MELLIGMPGYRTTRSTKGIPPHAYAGTKAVTIYDGRCFSFSAGGSGNKEPRSDGLASGVRSRAPSRRS